MSTRIRITGDGDTGGDIRDHDSNRKLGTIKRVPTGDGGYAYEATSTDGTARSTGWSPLNTAYRMVDTLNTLRGQR